jgi:predicted nucleotidyltransferase
LKADIVELVGVSARDFILFGSAVASEGAGDIDVAIVVDDGTDLFEFVELIAPVMACHSNSFGRLVSCFPITETAYSKTLSQFVANVKAHGRNF